MQNDGSNHPWLEDRGTKLTSCCIAVDDATGTVAQAVFRTTEDTRGYLVLLEVLVRQWGIPLDLYSDRHAAFKYNARQVAGACRIHPVRQGDAGVGIFVQADLRPAGNRALRHHRRGQGKQLWSGWRVDVLERADGELMIRYHGETVDFQEAPPPSSALWGLAGPCSPGPELQKVAGGPCQRALQRSPAEAPGCPGNGR